MIAKDSSLVMDLVNHLLHTINYGTILSRHRLFNNFGHSMLTVCYAGLLTEEKGSSVGGKAKSHTATPMALSVCCSFYLNCLMLNELCPDCGGEQATAALGEIMGTEELSGVIASHYALFMGSLLVRFGTSAGQADALKFFSPTYKFLTSKQ